VINLFDRYPPGSAGTFTGTEPLVEYDNRGQLLLHRRRT
jgi:hypothetical protein